ncbi:hypothetical protein niasHT_008213 [Heterodera trifolii]|uniref:NR LBD domain-containing protein n=1 Tax=Heterodera trifolii TaxID=157864 RepID=A0ABD2LUE3_9BILA
MPDYPLCKRCRLNKCLTVGMNPRGVCVSKVDEHQMLAFVQRIKQQPQICADLNSVSPKTEKGKNAKGPLENGKSLDLGLDSMLDLDMDSMLDLDMDSMLDLDMDSMLDLDMDSMLDLDMDSMLDLDMDSMLDLDMDSMLDLDMDSMLDLDMDSMLDLDMDSMLDLDMDSMLDLDMDSMLDLDMDSMLDLDMDSMLDLDMDSMLDLDMDSMLDLDMDSMLDLDMDSMLDLDLDSILDPDLDSMLDLDLDKNAGKSRYRKNPCCRKMDWTWTWMQEKSRLGSSSRPAPQQKQLLDLVMLKHLLGVEQKVCRIRNSRTPVPELFYDKCDSFESIFERKLNLLDRSSRYSIEPPNAPPAALFEKIRQLGPFFVKPPYFCLDLLFVFEIAKTFPSFGQLSINDKIALCSNIAMPLFAFSRGFYSVQQNCDVICNPCGVKAINTVTDSCFSQDAVAMKMGDNILCKAVQPFSRLKLSTEEFVLVRAIIYSHMGLSDHGQKLLFTEAEKYASLLMRNLQMNYGPAPGALRYVELMGLIEGIFNTGVKYRRLLTYYSIMLDRKFDKVFPPVFAQISTKGPVESHQLFP